MPEKNNQNIKNKILSDINQNSLKPKPKWLFAFKSFSFFVFVLFLFIFTFYILAFTAFVIRDHNWITGTTFTIKGFYLLLQALPWTLLISSLFMIFIAGFISRRYSLSYKKPFIYTLLGIIFILFITHFTFVSSGARDRLKLEAYKRGVQLAPSALLELRSDMQKMRIYENK